MPPRKKPKTAPKADESFGECLSILKLFVSKPDTEAFRDPVDWKSLGLDDYPKMIKQPMDLSTIQQNIENSKYSDPEDFADDVRLVWMNAMTYNQPGSEIHKVAEKYLKMFDKKWVKLRKQGDRRKKSVDGKEVSKQDRIKFSQLVNQLDHNDLELLVSKIQKECPDALTEESDDELEIEINNIDAATLASLNSFCNKCIKKK